MPFRGKTDLQLALDVTTLIDEHQLRSNPGIPRIYSAGVPYARDVCLAPRVPGACERFLTVLSGLAEYRAGGIPGLDCDDLGPWLAAQMRIRDGLKNARAFPIRSPNVGWHILVNDGLGNIHDPSIVLGMKAGR